MFQNILLNKCSEVEECHKTDVLNDFEKSLSLTKKIKDKRLNYLLMLNIILYLLILSRRFFSDFC